MRKLSSINIDGTLGKLALTPGLNNCYLAYTAGTGNGDVIIYELNKCTKQTTINAYKKPVVQMRFDINGSLLATACSDGKTIRIFSVPSGRKVYSLHRGIHEAEIHSMSFDPTSTLLGLTSVRGTLHIFRLTKSPKSTTESKMEQYLSPHP
eukprot:TRINITY_DN6245_c0_g2_i2.p2 TRINITY_DN6245_c0_g2~~TRINITY_DN6245_c0_g2_i2.p2  ORF type:complete len:151 (+),score=18.59 TRINITY_DN6245_c0_g2_i2:336-788(+)